MRGVVAPVLDIFLAANGSFFRLSEKRERLVPGDPFIDPAGYHEFVRRSEIRFEEAVTRRRVAPHAPRGRMGY